MRLSDKEREDSLQHTRYPITTLELILFVILVLTFIVMIFLCLYLPSGSEPHL
jgi:cell division protein FtsL